MTVAIARLKISLDDVTPKVVRRLAVPFTLRLDHLHLVFQAALGWENDHLWEFRIGGAGFGIPDPSWPDGPLDARKASLQRVIADTGVKRFRYLYDFGDGWEHTVVIEKIEPMRPGLTYPFLLAAAGRCPPEDVGGPSGYAEYIEALADANHERHIEMLEWRGSAFDPAKIKIADLHLALDDLARTWSKARKPKTK
ncbi:MAG: plasmid pRiA4b ORF-3 family protein [Microcystis panniformis]